MQTETEVEEKLIESFKTLVMEKPFEKITVSDITDGAGVIRTTFYNHFHDKYEVIERIINKELLNPIEPLLMNELIKEALMLVFINLEKEKPFYRKLLNTEGQNSLADIVRECVYEKIEMLIRLKMGGKQLHHSWLTVERVSKYYGQSISYMILEMIGTDIKISPREVADIYDYIVNRSLEDVIEELKNLP
ncbi:MAG TPA: TetR family transcriptional regulator [Lachnospiraceae bacterium]|nr:TetR family transcriptional regulator [Lachnospiraceae bacterium]